MKHVLFVTIAALTLTGCNLPDVDLPAYTPRTSAQAVPTADPNAATAQQRPPQKPAAFYDADQAPENTGDYSNYF